MHYPCQRMRSASAIQTGEPTFSLEPPEHYAVYGALGVYYALLLGPLLVGCSRFFLQLVRGDAPTFSIVFSGFQWKACGVLWLSSLVILGGYVLLIIPGIIAKLGFAMVFFVLADQPKLGCVEALHTSWDLAASSWDTWWRLFWLLTAWATLVIILCVTVVGSLLWLGIFTHSFLPYALSSLPFWVLGPAIWTSLASFYVELQDRFVGEGTGDALLPPMGHARLIPSARQPVGATV